MIEGQQLVRRSRVGIASLWAVALTDAAAIPAGFWFTSYLNSLAPDAVVEQLDPVPSEVVYGLVGIAQLAAIVVAGVFFIRWFHRAHLNLTNFTDSSTSYNSRWAIWGFFVPFLNLVRPRQLMREVWDTTSRVEWSVSCAPQIASVSGGGSFSLPVSLETLLGESTGGRPPLKRLFTPLG